jgi:hypothetical protein
MQANSPRLRYLVPASSLLALLLLTQSIAETQAQTSQPSARRGVQTTGWNPLTWFETAQPKPVPSSQKRKKTALQATLIKPNTHTAARTLLAAVDKTDIRQNHRLLADTVLRELPSGCRDNLKNFYVRYGNATSRGLGGKTTIILDGMVPDTEFMALLVHECGHVIHSNLQGTPSAGLSVFRDGQNPYYKNSVIPAFMALSWETENVLRADSRPADFLSGYARSDAHEDFSETFAAYVLHPKAFEERAKGNAVIAAKLQWMKTNLPLERSVSNSSYAWDGDIPWDVTKLPYNWKS